MCVRGGDPQEGLGKQSLARITGDLYVRSEEFENTPTSYILCREKGASTPTGYLSRECGREASVSLEVT